MFGYLQMMLQVATYMSVIEVAVIEVVATVIEVVATVLLHLPWKLQVVTRITKKIHILIFYCQKV